MLLAAILVAAVTFAESKTLAVQIRLDQAGYSCNTIDGSWGPKSQRALEQYLRDHGVAATAFPSSPEEAYDRFFAKAGNPLRYVTVDKDHLAAIMKIPADPAARAQLDRMGYESALEMFAEIGHLSRRALERLNPGVDWNNLCPGTKILLPSFPSMEEELSVWPKDRPGAPERPEAATVKISLSSFEITVLDAAGRTLAVFPCSIAANKAKLPSAGALKITNTIANPNYTYTPDKARNGKVSRHVWPPGPNCPVGVAWLGLNLPGYGIHGTPNPETIGRAESHGCFRLSNWNAARLYAMCRPGTKAIVVP